MAALEKAMQCLEEAYSKITKNEISCSRKIFALSILEVAFGTE